MIFLAQNRTTRSEVQELRDFLLRKHMRQRTQLWLLPYQIPKDSWTKVAIHLGAAAV